MKEYRRETEVVDLPPDVAFEEALKLIHMGNAGTMVTEAEMRRARMIFVLCQEYCRRTVALYDESLGGSTIFLDEPAFFDRKPQ